MGKNDKNDDEDYSNFEMNIYIIKNIKYGTWILAFISIINQLLIMEL